MSGDVVFWLLIFAVCVFGLVAGWAGIRCGSADWDDWEED